MNVRVFCIPEEVETINLTL